MSAPGYASLCVLSYNRPQLLNQTLETLRHNADAPFELIVHDDGSIDPDVYTVLEAYQRRGAFSTLILNPPGHNQGQGTALNRMFRIATGDPIIKLDQDLVFADGWLRRVNEILAGNRARDRITLARAHQRAPEPLIGLLGLLHYHHDPVASIKTRIAGHNGWSEHTHILGSAFAVRRECWDRLGPFEEHSKAFAEDWEFQRKVTDSAGDPAAHRVGHEKGIGPKGYVCALPPVDLCTNVGMGPGPSTVVREEDGEIKVTDIHTAPLFYDPRTAVAGEA